MVAAILEDKLCLPAHFVMHVLENLQTSEVFFSKTFNLNDIKFSREVL